MSRKTNTASAVVTEFAVTGLAELQAKQAELKEKKKLFMAVESLRKWEEETLAVNPSYIPGSLRNATADDTKVLGHCHGQVCLIKCESCGVERLVNKQDAKQTRFCKACKKGAASAKGKERRVAKKLAGKSAESIQAEIDQLNAMLEKM